MSLIVLGGSRPVFDSYPELVFEEMSHITACS